MTTYRPKAGVLLAALVLILVGSVFVFYSANPWGLFFFAGAAVCVVWAFRRFAGATAAILAAGVCALAAWATLGGGAESWTAIPWIASGIVFAIAAAYLLRRRLRRDAIT